MWEGVELGLSSAAGESQAGTDKMSTVSAPPLARDGDRPLVAPSRPLPSLADAFAAILASERQEGAPDAAPSWPAESWAGASVGEDLVEQVVTRVLARLSDRVVRETVSEIVSKVAANLVREEIERIKASVE